MTEKEIIIRGYKVRCAEKCDSNNKVVYVFLHGWGSEYTVFKPLFRLVGNVLAFDFPGFGGSSPLQEVWTLTEYAAILRECIEKKRDNRQVVFIAHSFGGRVLLKMLSQQSKMAWVRRVVCIGVPFEREWGMAQRCIQAVGKMAKTVLSVFPKSAERAVRKRWYALLGVEDYAALENEVMKRTFQNIIATDMRHLATFLDMYTADFIWGTDDIAAPIEDAQEVAQKVGATLHRIEEGDHFPFLGDTEERFKKIFKDSIAV